MLRKKLSEEQDNFYTYSAEHLTLSFPMVNEGDEVTKEREEAKSKWKTKAGFDNKDKKANFNEHPKRPPQSVIDDLQRSYWSEKQD